MSARKRARKTKEVSIEDTKQGPTVFCSHSKMVPIGKLVENPKNPNTHPKSQLELLAKIIEGQGWRNPIVVSNRSGFIIKGHGRYQAALILGVDEVPVDYQDYESEASEWADMIADNRISELSEIDTQELGGLIQELEELDFDMDLTGFTSLEEDTGQGSTNEYPSGVGEIDIDSMDDTCILKIPLSGEEYQDILDAMRSIDDNLGNALVKLLDSYNES
jgi:hypothetical protein